MEKRQVATDGNPVFNSDERQAMRAFLQRAEVRLSTMHRIAGSFLNGAGLLVLFPPFLFTVISSITDFLFPVLNSGASTPFRNIAIIYAFIASLAIPLVAVLFLLEDLAHFYFVGHAPGFSRELFYPRFALAAIAFSPDESEAVKRRVQQTQYSSDLINFIVPYKARLKKYFLKTLDKTNRAIIPTTRELQKLQDDGVLILKPQSNPKDRTYEILTPEGKVNVSQSNIDAFNTALGLAGLIDRDLVDEVAKIEASLVRHSLLLRRLVLRYLKALLLFIWTTLVALTLLVVLKNYKVYEPADIFLWVYLIWAISNMFVVRIPIMWIYRIAYRSSDSRDVSRDRQLVLFELMVLIVCGIAVIMTTFALFDSVLITSAVGLFIGMIYWLIDYLL